MLTRLHRLISPNCARSVKPLAAATLAVTFGALAAAPAAARQQADQQPKTLLAFDCAGLPSLLVSEKDAALAHAFSMFPARIEELRLQVPEFAEAPRSVTDLLFSMIGRPVRLAVTNKGFDPETGMPGIGATLSFHMRDQQDAVRMGESLNSVRTMAFGATPVSDSTRWKGMTDLPLPFGVLSYGPRQAPDGWRYEMLFGAVETPDAAFAGMHTDRAVPRPAIRGSLDLAALTPLTQMLAGFAAMAAPRGQDVVAELRRRGLMGPEAVAYEFTHGFTDAEAINVLRVRRMAKFAEASGLSTVPLTATDLAVVPADATAAYIARYSAKSTWNQLRTQFESAMPGQIDQFIGMVRDNLGIDIEADVINALGDTFAVYVSDSTGGGSILSGVAAISLSDPARFATALERAAQAFNHAAAENMDAPGAVRMDAFTQQGVRYLQLRSAGLPIPMEPTIAISGNWLVIGATPAASVAAARFIAAPGRSGGLAANPAFAKHRPKGNDPVMIAFVDSARTMSRGYPLLSFATSAVANAMRSSHPGVEVREPGFLLPTYSELAEGVRPFISLTYWDDQDMVTESHSDRSMLVNAAAILGLGDLGQIVSSLVLGAGIGAGISSEMGNRSPQWQSDEIEPMDDHMDPEAPSEERPRRSTPY